jgi:ubiquinone/menaquinone biosynthesis C-methylase UbiE
MCSGYIGTGAKLAAEYHSTDFNWQEHAEQICSLVEEQHRRAQEECSTSRQYEGHDWERFYQSHPSARFFKERRYLLKEFPILAQAHPPKLIVEIGCGCGASLLPVLKANGGARAVGTDISSTCLEQLRAASAAEGIGASRLELFTADGTELEQMQRYAGLNADVVMIMFTLSAVLPEAMLVMLKQAAAALKPAGVLLIRDHGLYDMVQLRMPPSQCIGQNLYKRGDGTISYFFSKQDLAEKARTAGLEVDELEYACVYNTNRKTGLKLKRVFVHGIFHKPATTGQDA